MTEGEKKVWVAAYVQTLHNGHMEQHALYEAHRTVTNLRDCVRLLGRDGLKAGTQVAVFDMAREVLSS